jgi:hypothetical protein
MATREIPRGEWAAFFDGFSQRHKGWLVTIEMLNPEIGDQIQARDLPLEGITLDRNGRGDDSIEVIAGAKAESHISHSIGGPLRVWLKQTREGADEVLEIESRSGAVLLRFRVAVLPEMVDGVVAG